MSRSVQADAHFLCNEAAVIGVQIKGRPSITTSRMKFLGHVVVTISRTGHKN
jgi:hypothetical protein